MKSPPVPFVKNTLLLAMLTGCESALSEVLSVKALYTGPVATLHSLVLSCTSSLSIKSFITLRLDPLPTTPAPSSVFHWLPINYLFTQFNYLTIFVFLKPIRWLYFTRLDGLCVLMTERCICVCECVNGIGFTLANVMWKRKSFCNNNNKKKTDSKTPQAVSRK